MPVPARHHNSIHDRGLPKSNLPRPFPRIRTATVRHALDNIATVVADAGGPVGRNDTGLVERAIVAASRIRATGRRGPAPHVRQTDRTSSCRITVSQSVCLLDRTAPHSGRGTANTGRGTNTSRPGRPAALHHSDRSDRVRERSNNRRLTRMPLHETSEHPDRFTNAATPRPDRIRCISGLPCQTTRPHRPGSSTRSPRRRRRAGTGNADLQRAPRHQQARTLQDPQILRDRSRRHANELRQRRLRTVDDHDTVDNLRRPSSKNLVDEPASRTQPQARKPRGPTAPDPINGRFSHACAVNGHLVSLQPRLSVRTNTSIRAPAPKTRIIQIATTKRQIPAPRSDPGHVPASNGW